MNYHDIKLQRVDPLRRVLVSTGTSQDEYLPSLYGTWKIKLYNQDENIHLLQKLHLPEVEGKLYLRARVRTCSPNADISSSPKKVVSCSVICFQNGLTKAFHILLQHLLL